MYGGLIALDSIFNYLEELRQIDLPDIQVDTIIKDKARWSDKDILIALNLLWNIKDGEYGYPKITYASSEKDSLTALCIGDSFFYTLKGYGFLDKAFHNSEFWFYNKDISPKRNGENVSVSDLNLKEELEKFDLILLLANEATCHSFAWGSIEDIYQVYYGAEKSD